MLSKRQRNILSYLSSENNFVTISELASLFQVSERTIQYDLEYIESFKDKLNIDVERNKSLGVKLSHKESYMASSDVELDIHYSKNERKEQIILRLFESTHPISSQSLADLLNVSRRTVVDDLKSVQAWLETYGLMLEYKKNKGFVIEGNEKQLREAYAHVVNEYFKKSTAQIGIEVFSKEELEKIRRAVITTINNQDFQLVQVGIDGLIYHIIIAIHRAKAEFVFEIPDEEYERLRKTEAFQIAIQMTAELEKLFDIAFPKSEAAFITLHLLGARVNKYHQEQSQQNITELSKLFIQKVSAQIGVPLMHDHKLITGLVTHLQPAIHRMSFNMQHENPLKQEILREYYEVVLAIKQQVWIFEEAYHVKFNEDEIAYLALHIASSIERMSSEETTHIKVILLCGSGVGTSQLLKSRIKNIYPELEILDAFSIYDISESFLKSHGVDYILSTVPVEGFSVPTIEVSPFLNKDDRNKINEMINDYRERYISSFKTVGPTLEDVIPEEHIETHVKAGSRNEAIQKSVAILVNSNHVNAQYGTDIMKHLDKFGPYMVIGPNIALLHSNFENVNVPVSMAITHFEDGIDFGHDRFDPVKVVITLATSRPQIHLNALGQLSQIIMDEDARAELMKGDKAVIRQLIKKASQSEESV
ncbi:BglG family transcription antiterminator [Mammaliicoccus sciuri]|uniref:BglG family transcription antiterminator n=1 Tax=Mammaliicoccus sciuri TaxID=1296 RepID=UPI0027378A80|nr:BglG family transcription antiterminator [Mammaliicoccus sciuri]